MTTASSAAKNNSFPLALLGAAAALLTLGVLTGQATAFGLSDRTSFFITAGIGFTMCAFSPLGKGAVYGWMNPLHIVGYVLGSLALGLIAAVLFGWPLPAWLAAHSAAPAIAALIALKIFVAALYPRRK